MLVIQLSLHNPHLDLGVKIGRCIEHCKFSFECLDLHLKLRNGRDCCLMELFFLIVLNFLGLVASTLRNCSHLAYI